MQKKIADATASELAEFAKVHFGIEGIRHTMGKDRILAELAKVGFSADEIVVEALQAPAAPATGMKAEDFGSQERIRLYINEQDGPGGNEPVWVAVNGRGQWIPRGKEVVVRKPYIEALKNATRRVPVKGENESIVSWREVPMYQYQILGPAEPVAA